MKHPMVYLLIAGVAGSILALEFLFNKTFRRRAVELEEKAEELIENGVTKTVESIQELKNKGLHLKIREEINKAFDNAAKAIGKGAENVEGALENAKI